MANSYKTNSKKLIEVALPLSEINDEAAQRNTKSPKGWPSTFHKWWSPKPLAIARAVILSQILDDPSSRPDLYPTIFEQDKERERLLELIAKASQWSENLNLELHGEIRKEIDRSLNGKENPPLFLDPFSGSGAIPLSAQFLGISSLAADINPVASFISKGLLDLPSRNWGALKLPEEEQSTLLSSSNKTEKLARLFEFYSSKIKRKLYNSVGSQYPGSASSYDKTKQIAAAYFWAWAVRSPNPSFSECWTPLSSTFVLCNRSGKEVYIKPLVNGKNLSFEIVEKDAEGLKIARQGTKVGRGANFRCIYTNDPISSDYIKSQGKQNMIAIIPTAIAFDHNGKRYYTSPEPGDSGARKYREKEISEDLELPFNPRAFWSTPYGFDTFGSLFTDRQYNFLSKFASYIPEICEEVKNDLSKTGNCDELISIAAEAVAIYLTALLNRLSNYNSTLNAWLPKDNAIGPAMPQQTIGISWGFSEANPFGKTSGSIDACSRVISSCIRSCTPNAPGESLNIPVQELILKGKKFIISTDPPYYDNIPYASLSDYFYFWARKALKDIYPRQFATIRSPVSSEIIADPYREGDKQSAEEKFLSGLSKALCTLRNLQDPSFPITIFYAFKQRESDGEDGSRITGWETFLQAVINSGLAITATWPIRTERKGRMRASDANTLASSILICCRQRPSNAPTISLSEFKKQVKNKLPDAIRILEKTSLAPIDFLQAAIGKGIEIYSRNALIYDTTDRPITPRQALSEIQIAVEELLKQGMEDYDQETKFAVQLFQSHGYENVPFGDAETLALALNISVGGTAESGIIRSSSGQVQLIKREQLLDDWSPPPDGQMSIWMATQYLINSLENSGENSAAQLLKSLRQFSSHADLSSDCRALAYQLYTFCEKTKQTEEARAYNGLVIAWPELERLATSQASESAVQTSLI